MKRFSLLLKAAILFFFSLEIPMLAAMALCGVLTAGITEAIKSSPYNIPHTTFLFAYLIGMLSLLAVIATIHEYVIRWRRMENEELESEIRLLWKEEVPRILQIWLRLPTHSF